MNLYARAVQCMQPHQIDHFRSDLYLLMTTESLALVNEFRDCGGWVDHVVENDTGLYWYYIPWGYTPYWQKHFRSIVENLAWEFVQRNEHSYRIRDWSDNNLRVTFSSMRKPPHSNLYPAIRGALGSILSAYAIHNSQVSIAS